MVVFVLQLLFSVKLADRLDVHDPLQDYIREAMHMEKTTIDSSITWESFQQFANGKSSTQLANSPKVEEKFMGRMVEWSGTVLRVDSFDEDMEYVKKMSSY